MKKTKLLIGILCLILAFVCSGIVVHTPTSVVQGNISVFDYAVKMSFALIAAFVCAAVASYCLLRKVGIQLFHSIIPGIAISFIGILLTILVSLAFSRRIEHDIVNFDFPQLIRKAIAWSALNLLCGLFTGFGIASLHTGNPRQITVAQKHEQNQLEYTRSANKNKLTAILLSIFTGGLGIDRFYLGYTGLGVLKLLTAGGLGVWSLIDLIMICTGSLRPADGSPWEEELRTAQPSPSPAKSDASSLEALERLAKLHEQGVLTDEEFQQKKADLLSKM